MASLPNVPRLTASLAREIRGEVLTDEPHLAVYSTAACIYEVRPLAIVRPRDAADVAATVRFAAENGIPVTPRGAGSGLAGSALGSGLILDFTRHMRTAFPARRGDDVVRVQPGVVLAELNARLAHAGKMIGPDPSSEAMCTLGGMIATNASGARGLRFGSTADHVRSLDVVLSDGSFARIESGDGGIATGASMGRVRHQTAELLLPLREEIAVGFPATRKNTAGYDLRGATAGGDLDLVKLLVGSEGTLAVVVEATVGIVDRPAHRASQLFFFPTLERAGEAVQPLVEGGAAAIELMEERFLGLARAHGVISGDFLPERARAVLLVEFLGEREENEERLRVARQTVVEKLVLALGSRESSEPTEQESLWRLRKCAVQTLYRLPGPRRAVPFIEDTAVPPAKLVEYIRETGKILARHGVEAAVIGHAGEGNLHMRPLLDLRDPADVERMRLIADEIYELTISLHGSVSAEHGDGRLRSGYLRRQYGKLYPLFARVKRIWDSGNVFNPGVIVTVVEGLRTDHLRMRAGGADGGRPRGSAFVEERLTSEIERCHGCGTCRAVCPVFLATREELDSPRAHARLLAAAASGTRAAGLLEAETAADAFRRCLGCGLCLAECPSEVAIPALAIAAKAEAWKREGPSIADRLFSDPPRLARAARRLASLVNAALGWKPVRRLVPGLAPESRPPRLTRPFRLPARPAAEPRRVVYFPGCHARFHAAPVADAAARLLGGLYGPDLHVAGEACCGLPALSVGDVEGARRQMGAVAQELVPLLAERGSLVSGCPSCVLAFRDDFPTYLGSEAAGRLSRAAASVVDLLLVRVADLHPRAGLPPLAYHSPCHARARGEDRDLVFVRALGIEPVLVNTACCGMGGAWGLKRGSSVLSQTIGRPVFDRLRSSGARAIVSGCGMCAEQLRGGTGLPVLHPMELLAT